MVVGSRPATPAHVRLAATAAVPDLDWVEFAARDFEKSIPRSNAQRRWATPGAMAQAIDVETKQTPALELIDQALVRVADGVVEKQMIFCPPQIGKSERAVRRFVEWLHDHDPKLRIVIASFDQETATRWGRRIKQDVEMYPEIAINLRTDSKAAGRWDTAEGGGLYCVGIRGALSGRPVDICIIDDPVKDRAAAESETVRNATWDWYENVVKVRALRTVVIQTRWHKDDLSGRLQEREPGEWNVLSIPAIAETDDDPLGREVGEEMEPARARPAGYYSALQKTTSPYVWSSLYQQHPTAAAGGIFKRADWRYWEPVSGGIRVNDTLVRLSDCPKFITMDLATSTRTSADFTVAAAWAVSSTGDLILLDRVRDRVQQIDHMDLLEPLRSRWLGRHDTVWIESRMFGSTLVYALGKRGLPVRELIADTDKFTRALAAADLVSSHRVHLPRNAEWLDSWIDEHAEFQPKAARDDQVDVMAYAARVMLTNWLAPEDDHIVNERRVREAHEADLTEVDLETAIW